MLALRPAIGMVTFMVASAMISGAMPSSSLPRTIKPFAGHVTLLIVDENCKRDGVFVCHFAVSRFLFQINVSFKAETCSGAERFVQVNHLCLIMTRKSSASLLNLEGSFMA